MKIGMEQAAKAAVAAAIAYGTAGAVPVIGDIMQGGGLGAGLIGAGAGVSAHRKKVVAP